MNASAGRDRLRVVLVHNIIPPYRVPLFNALAKCPGVDFRVLFMARTEANRSWRIPDGLAFEHEFMKGLHIPLKRGAWTVHLNPGVVGRIRAHDPDTVILPGYDSLTLYLAALGVHVGRRRRVVSWAESNAVGKPADEGLRAAPKRWMMRHADHVLVPGRLAEEYLRRFTRPGVPFSVFPNVVDETRFRLAAPARAELRAATRARLGLEGTVVLFSGQMIERKGFHDLLPAFAAAEVEGPTTLLAVGSGALEPELHALAARVPAPKRVVPLPFQQLEALPGLYAAADVLVLPSREDPWPLVVVEAMHSGIPVVASDAVGNTPDLIREGETGWSFPAGDVAALRRRIESLAGVDLEAAGRRAQAWVGAYCSLDRCVASFALAVGAA
ncbi:MAG TPA: glycosyltransferase family 4 protein [Candidatus Polarisedimenticolaceae bacterium]